MMYSKAAKILALTLTLFSFSAQAASVTLSAPGENLGRRIEMETVAEGTRLAVKECAMDMCTELTPQQGVSIRSLQLARESALTANNLKAALIIGGSIAFVIGATRLAARAGSKVDRIAALKRKPLEDEYEQLHEKFVRTGKKTEREEARMDQLEMQLGYYERGPMSGETSQAFANGFYAFWGSLMVSITGGGLMSGKTNELKGSDVLVKGDTERVESHEELAGLVRTVLKSAIEFEPQLQEY